MDRAFFVLGALLAALGVAAGAFGAHSLRARLSPEMLGVFETGVRYHLIASSVTELEWVDGVAAAGVLSWWWRRGC